MSTPTFPVKLARRSHLRPFLVGGPAVLAAVIGLGLAVDATVLRSSFKPGEWLFILGFVTVSAAAVMALAARLIRRRSHEAETTEAKLHGLLECAPDAVLIMDRKGRIVLTNPRLEELLGYRRDELLGKPMEDLLQKEKVKTGSSAEIVLHHSSTGPEGDCEMLARRKDGTQIPVEITSRPLETRDGLFSINILRDISERKAREQRRAARHAVRRILADASSFEQAMPSLLQAVCTALRFDLGNVWMVDGPANLIRCCHTWSNSVVREPLLRRASRTAAFALGVGLPGRVWASRQPVCIPDVTQDPEFSRGPAAAKDGVHGAFAFPIVAGSEVLGVIECFSLEPQDADDPLAETLSNIGAEIGRFIRHQQAEQAIRTSEARKAAILESAFDAIVTLDQEGNVLEFNPAAERMFGYAKADAIGRPVADLIVPPGLRDQCRQGFAQFLAGSSHPTGSLHGSKGDKNDPLSSHGSKGDKNDPLSCTGGERDKNNPLSSRAGEGDKNDPLSSRRGKGDKNDPLSPSGERGRGEGAMFGKRVEMTARRADGSEFPVELAVAQIGGDGPPLFTAYIRDLTEQKQTGEALRRTEEQFRQAQKMEAVGRLAGGVAHDFNNLLTVITGYCEVLLGKVPDDSPLRKPIEAIAKAGNRAATLTRQLLAFSRKQVLEPKIFDLNAVVTDMNKMFHRLIGEDITLKTVLDPRLHLVKADPSQLEQVLMNLVVNARDAMPEGGTLTIETHNVEVDDRYARAGSEIKPGSYVMLAVTDTGCGIDEKTKARIFEPFFTTKEVGKGTGLGLATVYGIVKQSGGHIEVESAPGRGTAFRIYLPQAGEAAPEPQAAPAPATAPRGHETVLLVEDEEGVRALAREVLQESGYTVLEAKDGDDALEITARHPGPIHLLLTDVVMPGMSGVALAQRLMAARSGLRVLYTSGYTDSALFRYGYQEGDADFLMKPFTRDALVRAVRDVLDRRPIRRHQVDRRRFPRRPGRGRVELGQVRWSSAAPASRSSSSPRKGAGRVRGGPADQRAAIAAGSLVNISESGAGVVLDSPVHEGQEVEVALLGSAGVAPIKRTAKVQWSVATRDGHYCAGLRFRRRLSAAEVQGLTESPGEADTELTETIPLCAVSR
ncbi:MAG TPA: PAS domain S-box protein [Gemmataceae bacterium]|nr:PAS domain S-box protein [Gemmataceae bacterium]